MPTSTTPIQSPTEFTRTPFLFLLALALASLSYSSTQENDEPSSPSAAIILCSGIVTGYLNNKTPAQLTTHGCVWFEKTTSGINDATWVKITSPEAFEGVTHILITNDRSADSPFGRIGDEIQFSAAREQLESDQQWLASTPSLSPEGR